MKLTLDKTVVTLAALAACALSLPGHAAQLPTCVLDQYGNRYEYTIDTAHDYVYGTVTSVQGCTSTVWPLTGSFVRKNQQRTLELTAANPTPSSCVPTFKLKGIYPAFAWYYANGYGAQESTYVACSSAEAQAIVPQEAPGQGMQR